MNITVGVNSLKRNDIDLIDRLDNNNRWIKI